jgi:DNA polymerase V
MNGENPGDFPSDPRDLRQLGFKSHATEYIGQSLSLDQRFVTHKPATYYWRVNGDEVRRLGFRDGDLLVVDKSLQPRHGCLAVCVIDGQFRVRRLRRWGDLLIPVPLHRPTEFNPFEQTEVWGVIRAVVREFKEGIRDECSDRPHGL